MLVALRGGILGGISLIGSNSASLQLKLNSDHLGQVVTPSGSWGPAWVPLLSLKYSIDSDFALFGVPVLLVAALRTAGSFAAMGLISAAALLLLWMTVYPSAAPGDAYRFGHSAMVLFLALGPIAIASIWKDSSQFGARARTIVVAVVVVMLTMPHLALVSALTFSPPAPSVMNPADPDYQAALYLRGSNDTWRILVPLDRQDDNWQRLYRAVGPPRSIRILLGLSGHVVPTGFVQYFDPGRYLPTYRRASIKFEAADLTALKVDWVYVLPSYLSEEQRSNLQNVIQKRELVLEKRFGEEGQDTERLLYRVVGNSR